MKELTQQELLKAIMFGLDLSRAELSRKYVISTRALSNWLLPDESKGFRKMPGEMHARLTDDLIGLLTRVHNEISMTDFEGRKDELIKLERNSGTIYFPELYFGRSEFNPVDDLPSNMPKQNVSEPFFSEYVTLDPKSNIHIHIENLKSTETRAIKNAHAINGDNYWVHLAHYKTTAEAQAAYDILFSYIDNLDANFDAENMLMSIQLVSFNGSQFLLYLQPAPDWHNKPLICYRSKGLVRNGLGSIDCDHWQHVIDEKGDSIKMPRRPDEDFFD